jgi:hypothetical protein
LVQSSAIERLATRGPLNSRTFTSEITQIHADDDNGGGADFFRNILHTAYVFKVTPTCSMRQKTRRQHAATEAPAAAGGQICKLRRVEKAENRARPASIDLFRCFRTVEDGYAGEDRMAEADEQYSALRDQIQQPESSFEARKSVSLRTAHERVLLFGTEV